MKIHIAILTYNALAYTKRCIDTLLAHTNVPFEVMIVDNASSDGTQDWLATLSDARIRVHYSQENLGVPGGRNELLRHILPRAADDEFVIFLDNDIELHAGWHEPFERLFHSQPRAGMASKVGWVMQVREDTRDPHTQPWETGRVDIVAGGFACWARVEAIHQVGDLDENLGLFWHEDDDWAVRFTAAGWSIWSVPEASMTHHEHASGVAWPSLENGDSTRNLAYLSKKWREMGIVDEEGWIRDRDLLFCPSLEVRAEMTRRLGRGEPLSRGEYVEAFWDLHALLATLELGRVFPRPVSPCLNVLLELLCENHLFHGTPETQKRYLALTRLLGEIRTRRNLAPARTPLPATSIPATEIVSGLARASSWEDERWLAAYHEVKGPGSTADWYGRSSLDWAETSLFYSLSQQDLLRDGKRGLILDPHGVSLAIGIAERGTDLLLAGHFDIASEAGGELPPEFLNNPRAWLGGEGLDMRVCRRSELGKEALFDFVIARMGLVGDAEDPALQEKLAELSAYLAPGGQAALIVEVPVGLDGQSAFTPMPSTQGLKLRPGFQAFINSETLEACASPISKGRAPELCRCHGTTFRTHALLIYEKQADASLLHPHPHPRGHEEVLVDLRGMDLDLVSLQDSTREGLAQLESVLLDPGHPRLTLLGDGPCHQVLSGLLVHPSVRYRDSNLQSSLSPDLIQYLEGPRKVPPRCNPEWKGKPVLGFLGALSRDRLLHGQDPWNEATFFRFLQTEATALVVPGSDRSAWGEDALDLGAMEVCIVPPTRHTLQASHYSQEEAKLLVGVSGPYLLLEGSLGARDSFAGILGLLQNQVLSEGLSVLAYGREFDGFEALCAAGGHPVLERMRIVSQLPEALRRPLFEGAVCFIDARRDVEFRLGAIEAGEISLPVRRLTSGHLVDSVGPAGLPAELPTHSGLGQVWCEVLAGRSNPPGGTGNNCRSRVVDASTQELQWVGDQRHDCGERAPDEHPGRRQ